MNWFAADSVSQTWTMDARVTSRKERSLASRCCAKGGGGKSPPEAETLKVSTLDRDIGGLYFIHRLQPFEAQRRMGPRGFEPRSQAPKARRIPNYPTGPRGMEPPSW